MRSLLKQNPCDNLNHRRENARVRHCPTCGSMLNPQIGAPHCNDEEHAIARRQRNDFCVSCGIRLIARDATLR